MIFSVVIPTFNRPVSLRRAVQSCLNQNFDGVFEIIVVNDGGQYVSAADLPNSRAIDVRIENIVNGGVSEARNHGIAKAQGRWILLLDDDDFFLPNHLSIIGQHLPFVPESVGWISTDCLQLRLRGTQLHIAKKSGQLSVQDFLAWDAITTNVSCFRKSFHSPFPSKIKYLEDFEHRLKIIRQGGYYRINEVTSVFDSTHQSATNGTLESHEMIEEYLRRFDQIFSEFPEFEKFKDRRKASWLWRKFSDLSLALGRKEIWSICWVLAANLHRIRRVNVKDFVSITLKRLFANQNSS